VKKSAKKGGAQVTLAKAIAKFKSDEVRVDPEEWDFSTCPKDQLEACFFYEFARECPEAVRAARALREHLKEIGADTGTDHRFAVTVVDIFKDCPEFPHTPFLSIPTAERYRRIKKVGKVIPPVQADLAGLIRQYEGKAVTGKTIKYGQGDIVGFYLDWTISDEKLIEGLRHSLKTNRPPGAVATVRRGQGSSAQQIRKDLKALGAWRLLEKMDWEDAHVYSREILKNRKGQPQGLFGSHANAWRRAQKDAEKMIASICAFLERHTI
jgi:hypothetical protein